MKTITAILGLVFISSTVFAGDLKDIEISGFKAIEVTQGMMKLKFREEKPFIVSRAKFSSEDQAKVFCKENGLSLDAKGFDKTLLLAVSGAATLSEEIMQAISFKLNEQSSGIAAWTGENSQLMIMWNGRGTDAETVKVDDIAGVAQKLGNPSAATFSAVCE